MYTNSLSRSKRRQRVAVALISGASCGALAIPLSVVPIVILAVLVGLAQQTLP